MYTVKNKAPTSNQTNTNGIDMSPIGIEKKMTSIKTDVIGSIKSLILSSMVLALDCAKTENEKNDKIDNKKYLLSFFIKHDWISSKYMNLIEGTTIVIK